MCQVFFFLAKLFFKVFEWNHESIHWHLLVLFLVVHDNMNRFMYTMIFIMLTRIKIFWNLLNRFICVLGLMIFLDELYHCSMICNNLYLGFTNLIHTLACALLNHINIRLENLWFNSHVLWIVSIFKASTFPIFTCLNQFILSMIRIMSLFLPLKFHLSLMSIYS